MYLIYGDSFRIMEEKIEQIIQNETNVITMDLLEVTLEDVLIEANYVSMFNEKKFLIVKNALFFTSAKNKEELDALYSYMENPAPLTTIIFTTYEKIDLRKKITKEFAAKYKVISVSGLSINDLTTKVRDYIFKNKYKIDTETLSYILNACQNNYDLIYNEITKIFLFYNEPQIIKLEDVKNIVSRTMNDNNFKFVEAVINKDLKKATTILEDLYVAKVDPITLLMLLAREYRFMYSVIYLLSLGTRKGEICKELNLQEWQVDKLIKETSNYYKDDLLIFLEKLSTLDYQIKKGESDRFIALKTFLLLVD